MTLLLLLLRCGAGWLVTCEPVRPAPILTSTPYPLQPPSILTGAAGPAAGAGTAAVAAARCRFSLNPASGAAEMEFCHRRITSDLGSRPVSSRKKERAGYTLCRRSPKKFLSYLTARARAASASAPVPVSGTGLGEVAFSRSLRANFEKGG